MKEHKIFNVDKVWRKKQNVELRKDRVSTYWYKKIQSKNI